MGQAKAFEALRARLVAKHEEEIAALTKSLGKLKKLKMPNAEVTGLGRNRSNDDN